MNSNKLNKKDKIIISAFISLLVIISVPLGINHIEKAKEAMDLSNALVAYDCVYYSAKENRTDRIYYAGNGRYECSYKIVQEINGWSTSGELEVSDISSSSSNWHGIPTKGGTVKAVYENGQIDIYWN